MRLTIDFISVFVLIRFIYFPVYKNRENFFTLFIFNLIIFLITFILNKSDMSMGAAFGLFAVFSMLRYRTEGITTKDMTYMFLVIAMGLITALSKGNWIELSFINSIIIIFTLLLETTIIFKKEVSQMIQYENIELIKPACRAELKADLEMRMGITINRIEINKIDFLKDTANIRVYHYESKFD
ncbi:MAG: DUF4956 domain-containing protein [Bacteroidetes bacterium RIFCSPLOWO2_12_FULL_35_15]|nr:MAG: DUF4956 domain-containing protein [Bacteroidetes bacterium RIFCSPLOWO2_12_FULL_35_15]